MYAPSSTQEQVFEGVVQPLVDDFVRGYSCGFLCCGQNGSGKTYTLEGGDTPEDKGVIGRIADYLAVRLEGDYNNSTRHLLRVSYIEVYEEEIIDLL